MKVAYNACFGGFSLSHAGIMRYAKIKGIELYAFVDQRDKDNNLKLQNKPRPAQGNESNTAFIVYYCTSPEYSDETYFHDRDIDRTDPALIQTIEELGKAANGSCAELAIDDVPAGALYRIDEYDGRETVMTQDSYDWKVAS